jgi:hypothetical protein
MQFNQLPSSLTYVEIMDGGIPHFSLASPSNCCGLSMDRSNINASDLKSKQTSTSEKLVLSILYDAQKPIFIFQISVSKFHTRIRISKW